MRILRTGLLLVALAVPSVWLASGAHAADPSAPPIRTSPAANQVLTVAPSSIEISAPSGASAGSITVLSSNGQQVTTGALAPGGSGSLSAAVPTLAKGVYLVKWTAGSDSGTFAFDVAGDTSPQTVGVPKLKTTLGPMRDNLVEWVPLIAICIFVGALALRFLVSAPAARRAGRPDVRASTDRRLVQIAALGIAVFAPTTIAELAYSDGSFDFGGLWSSLGADEAGHTVGARLALTLIAALVVIPQAFGRRPVVQPLLALGLLCGLAELAGREVPTAVPPNVPRTVFNSVLYVLHLWGAAIWIGGLVGLLGLAVFSAVPEDARRQFWPGAIRRFSATAMGSVAGLTLSGLWLYWVHVDGVNQLVSTLYGQTLLVKVIVVAVLVLIGASNQFWLMPLLDRQRVAASDTALSRAVGRHFRIVIAIEVVLGLSVLFIAPLLGGSARNQAFQASPDVLAQSAHTGSTQVQLIPSGLQPGLIDYRVKLDGGPTPNQVSLDFASSKLDVAPTTVVANAIGEHEYRVSGFYTPVVGTWQVGVRLDGGDPATFKLAIATKAPKLAKSAAPKVQWTTWLAGILETLVVALALYSSWRVSRRLGAGPASAPPANEPEPQRDLIDA
jgi:putative copper export protein